MQVLSIGEALIDFVHPYESASIERLPGGSPLNVAVALGRLGHESYLLTHIAEDADADLIQRHLKASQTQLLPGSTAARQTSQAIARLDETGAATYEFHLDWDVDSNALAYARHLAPQVIHTGSIAALLEPGSSKVLRLLNEFHSQSNVIISFDPNIRPVLFSDRAAVLQRVEDFCRCANLVKLSDEDAGWLYPELSITQVAEHILDFGPTLVVITRGSKGAFFASVAGSAEVSPVKTRVVDTVGAGDTFSAGLIAALPSPYAADFATSSLDAFVSMTDFAARLAAITVSRAGANPPWAHEL